MFYNAAHQLKLLVTGIKRYIWHIVLWFACMPFFTLLYFVKQKSEIQASPGEKCVCDYLVRLSNGYFLNLFFIPLSIVIIFLISEQENMLNCIVRNAGRKIIITKQWTNMLFLSFIFSLYFVIVSIPIAGLFTSKILNWNEPDSMFFISHQYPFNTSVLKIVMATTFKIWILLFLFSTFMLMLNLCLNKLFSLLIIFILLSTNIISILDYFLRINLHLNNAVYSLMPPSAKILYFIIFPLLIIFNIIFSYRLIRRKDFLNI